jgi:hypothetical protein
MRIEQTERNRACLWRCLQHGFLHTPALVAPSPPPPQAWYLPQGPVAGLSETSGLFGPATHRSYFWPRTASPEAIIRELRTRSDYNGLPEDRREARLTEVGAALAAGWHEIEVVNETHLYLAKAKLGG